MLFLEIGMTQINYILDSLPVRHMERKKKRKRESEKEETNEVVQLDEWYHTQLPSSIKMPKSLDFLFKYEHSKLKFNDNERKKKKKKPESE